MKNMTIDNPILFVDDDQELTSSAIIGLKYRNIRNVDSESNPLKVMDLLSKKKYDLIFLDLWMPNLSGDKLLIQIVEKYPQTPVIMVTANTEVEPAIQCIKDGAANYLIKPVELNSLVAHIKQTVALKELEKENEKLKSLIPVTLDQPKDFSKIISTHDSMFIIFQYIEAIAKNNNTVLITGESGTGKEMIAQALHKSSKRSGQFIAVNVAGFDDTAIYSALFGHTKGSFTGAESARMGYIEAAQDGTLFLDEIGDLSIESQIKLLRLLQEKEYYPLGSDKIKKVNTRFVVATHQDISNPDIFREDLYYRLKTHHIDLPPLRDRKSDLIALTEHFIETYCKENNFNKPNIPKEIYPLLGCYNFPGNIRELRNIILDALVQAKRGNLGLDPIRKYIDDRKHDSSNKATLPEEKFLDLTKIDQLPTLKEIQETLVDEAINRSQGNQSIAAQMLGISRQALNKRLQKKEN